MGLVYNKKINKFTPLIRKIALNGGTFYTFSSAGEDLSLKLADTQTKKFRFSKFAVLRIPDLLNKPEENTFKLGAVAGNHLILRENLGGNINKRFAESFQNYCLNLESLLISQDTYNAMEDKTVAERVFWKWIKEHSAIRFSHNSDDTFKEEENQKDIYNRVVKYIGDVSFSGNHQNKFSTYSEVVVNIPETTGTTPNVLFKQFFDTNYNSNNHLKVNDRVQEHSKEYILGRNERTVHPDGLDVRAIYDNDDNFSTFPLTPRDDQNIYGFFTFKQISNKQEGILVKSNDKLNTWEGDWLPNETWFTSDENYNTTNLNELYTNSYFIDTKLEDLSEIKNENYAYYYGSLNKLRTSYIENNNDSNVDETNTPNSLDSLITYSTLNTFMYSRTNVDGIIIDWDLSDYEFEYDDVKRNYINLASGENSEDYDFNAILLYYDIYQTKIENGFEVIDESTVSTNLFGVLFLDDVKEHSERGGRIACFKKVKSKEGIDGESGNSFSFKFNLKIDQNTGLYKVDYIPVIAENNTVAMGLFAELIDKQVDTMNIFQQLNLDIMNLSGQAQKILKYQTELENVGMANLLERILILEEQLPQSRSNTLIQQIHNLVQENLELKEEIINIKNRLNKLETGE